jgi:hypothetical protein
MISSYAPKETHVQAVKMIFKYLKGTLDFDLWYSRGEDFTLTTYTNADWADNVDDKKSTSGGTFFLGNSLVSWLSKKQYSVLSIHNRSQVYYNNNMLHTSYLDEENIAGYQGRI